MRVEVNKKFERESQTKGILYITESLSLHVRRDENFSSFFFSSCFPKSFSCLFDSDYFKSKSKHIFSKAHKISTYICVCKEKMVLVEWQVGSYLPFRYELFEDAILSFSQPVVLFFPFFSCRIKP